MYTAQSKRTTIYKSILSTCYTYNVYVHPKCDHLCLVLFVMEYQLAINNDATDRCVKSNLMTTLFGVMMTMKESDQSTEWWKEIHMHIQS